MEIRIILAKIVLLIQDTAVERIMHFLEQQNQLGKVFIPPHGTYKGEPTGFVYNKNQGQLRFVHKER